MILETQRMFCKPVVRRFLILAALCTLALLLAAQPARAETVPPGANSPSVVMGAFKQGQVATGTNRAALVVRYRDGGVQTRCVSFEEDEIGGDELLNLTDLAPVFGFNLELCSINGQGCPSDDCFCECPSFPNCEYWAYYHLKNGAWEYSEVGASGYGVKNGDVEGWSWGPGDFTQGTQPPLMTFDEICNPQTQATATPTATATQQSGAAQIAFFTAQPASVQPPACATLSWQTTNAATVLLDGAPVAAQGTQTVCPTNTQTYALIAASATGQQVTGQVTVQVTPAAGGSGQGTPTPTATFAASATPAWSPTAVNVMRAGTPTPAYITPFPQPIVTRPPGAIPQPGQVVGGPSPDPNFSPLAPGQLVGGVPLAPTAEAAAIGQLPQAPQGPAPTATRFVFARPPTETPRPRRILGADGRPTPTPILVARAGGASGSDSSAAETGGRAPGATGGGSALIANGASSATRAFSPDLLPQYAGYLATLTLLLAVGWLVHRRRAAQPSTVAQPARDVERGSDRFASRDERTPQ